MKVTVKLFAGMAETYGRPAIEVNLPAGSRVAELRRRLAEEVAEFSQLMSHTLFAVAAEYVADDFPLSPGGDMACIPPVSGG